MCGRGCVMCVEGAVSSCVEGAVSCMEGGCVELLKWVDQKLGVLFED